MVLNSALGKLCVAELSFGITSLYHYTYSKGLV